MTEEIVALDLDWDLVQHLAVPESVARLKAERVTDELIEDEDIATIFRWQMAHYREHGEPATPPVLEDEFEDVTIEEPLTAIDDLIGRLRERYMRNSGLEALEGLINLYHKDPLDVAHTMYQEGRRLTDLITKRGEAFGPGDYDRSMALYDKQVLAGRGPSFGYERIDDHFYGQRGITFMLGPPKSLKSWVTVNSAIQNVIDGKCAALYSLELPAHEAYNRCIYMAANVPWWKFIKGALTLNERARIKEATDLLDECGTLMVMKPDVGERKADLMVDRARDLGADVIYIDQLQYMETQNSDRMIGSKNETGDYWEVCARLRDYSDDGPIWVVHQMNRTVMFADEMPTMQQIKGSAAVEETATTALCLWANKDMRHSKVVEMGTLASRNAEWYHWEFSVKMNKELKIEMIGQLE